MNVKEKKEEIRNYLKPFCYSKFLNNETELHAMLTELCEAALISYKKVIAPHVIAIRDEIVNNDRPDRDEIYHLHAIASPNFDKLSDDVWKEFEELIK